MRILIQVPNKYQDRTIKEVKKIKKEYGIECEDIATAGFEYFFEIQAGDIMVGVDLEHYQQLAEDRKWDILFIEIPSKRGETIYHSRIVDWEYLSYYHMLKENNQLRSFIERHSSS
mgnify:CR=1 FL=1